ncbi:HtaA domain-containing protein [Streptomyces sp. H34-S4]|nr:HtaA domain-containing protein [Streptomyces sp. H34-S4]MCY0937332.1 HtaA domain-containing protein [Streptomyces sp. H34-S4]
MAVDPAQQPVLEHLRGRAVHRDPESFRKYVQSAGGTVTPAGGAVANGDSFAFAGGKGTLDIKARKLNTSFAGNLRYQYAAHGIDMTFGNVRVNTEGAKGALVLDVKTAGGVKADRVRGQGRHPAHHSGRHRGRGRHSRRQPRRHRSRDSGRPAARSLRPHRGRGRGRGLRGPQAAHGPELTRASMPA